MALSTDILDTISAALQRVWSGSREGCTFSKAELRTAASNTDAWIEANAASFNSALNVGFRNKATQVQKTLLFCYVALKRAGMGVGGE